ncbi:DUF4878 domain-containing protein [Gordonia sp. HY285]|uniref:Rv0361 family membrane protein n=1 Tax=Gordonia liuliyuniae TaxID=2911517 RepID=UPI001F1BF3BE|nr:DUF4878 domain-containing protein [Gordonia liuliyuniae]MCF8608626.1 DUF4878 domain-containing protein [Gordonia liuliyuniae]
MPDSDNEKSAALDKVVGAFRARREQAADDASTGDSTASADGPTPVVKLGDSDAPEPKGGDSESPTRAFKVPTEVAAAAAAASGGATADGDKPKADNPKADNPEAESTDAGSTDTADESTGLVEETVVGEPTSAVAGDSDDADDERVEAPATSTVVEESVDVDAAGETPADDSAAEEESAESEGSTPTEQFAVPAAAAAATTKIDTQKPAPAGSDDETAKMAAATPTPTPEKPRPQQQQQQAAPQVIAPSEASAEKKGRGKVVAALVAVLVVVAAVAVGAWYLLKGSSPESEVADVATSYQEAMTDGDLSKLRDITCGEENKYYTTVSDEDFSKAYETQKNRNELMTFDDVDSVAIDGDTARAGVNMYNTSDSSKKMPAQITLHKVGDDWKVCTKVD